MSIRARRSSNLKAVRPVRDRVLHCLLMVLVEQLKLKELIMRVCLMTSLRVMMMMMSHTSLLTDLLLLHSDTANKLDCKATQSHAVQAPCLMYLYTHSAMLLSPSLVTVAMCS